MLASVGSANHQQCLYACCELLDVASQMTAILSWSVLCLHTTAVLTSHASMVPAGTKTSVMASAHTCGYQPLLYHPITKRDSEACQSKIVCY
jgi:hypothetical protein